MINFTDTFPVSHVILIDVCLLIVCLLMPIKVSQSTNVRLDTYRRVNIILNIFWSRKRTENVFEINIGRETITESSAVM